MWIVSQVLSHSAKGSAGQSGEINFHLVHETPAPIFAWLDRSHDGMLGPVKVFSRVLVFRRIATTHMAADHAQTQMDPGIADLQAVLTATCMRLDVSNLTDVRAFFHSISYQSQLFQICPTG
jgi:hypothetical protein